MTTVIPPPFTLVTYGTSLTTGRLSSFWPERLQQALLGVPEAIGPVIVYNLGKGSTTSVWGVDNAQYSAAMRPSHILSETFAINDCALIGSTPAVSISDNTTNMATMRAIWLAADPTVDITWQSMSSISTTATSLRPSLATYYNAGMAKAVDLGDEALDNYADWIKPLPLNLTDSSDGVHPIWTGGTETYLFPNVLLWARQKMATYWGLTPPT